jgi:hypothetical protein
LVPEDVHLSVHLLGAILGISVGNCGFILAGLIPRTSPLGRLRPLTLPLSILAMAATVLLFTGHTPGQRLRGDGTARRLSAPVLDGHLSRLPACGRRGARGGEPVAVVQAGLDGGQVAGSAGAGNGRLARAGVRC